VELIFDAQKPDTFANFLPELGDSPEKEELATKVLKAYTKVKENASRRYSRRKLDNSKWTPKTNDKVRVKTQPMSDVIKVTTSKFIYCTRGHFLFKKYYPHSAYEQNYENGRARGKFS
jgi:hypothetical protein